MTVQLTKYAIAKLRAIICWGTNPGPAKVARNIKQWESSCLCLWVHGVSSKKFIELAGEGAEGIILPSGRVIVADQLPKSDPQKKALINYVNQYREKYNVEGDHFGGHAGDAVMLLKRAIEQGAFHSRGRIRDQLEENKKNLPVSEEPFFLFSAGYAGLTSDAFV